MPSVRVKTPADAQERQHDPARHRVDQPQELRLLQSIDEERVQTQERREEAKAAEKQEICPVHATFGRAAADASPVCDQRDEDHEHDETVVGRDRMHVVGLSERGRICVAHAPGKSRARDRVVLAVDDVADAADRFAERDADHRDVEHEPDGQTQQDRKSTRLNSSHSQISYAVFCLKKKTNSSLTVAAVINSRGMGTLECVRDTMLSPLTWIAQTRKLFPPT